MQSCDAGEILSEGGGKTGSTRGLVRGWVEGRPAGRERWTRRGKAKFNVSGAAIIQRIASYGGGCVGVCVGQR